MDASSRASEEHRQPEPLTACYNQGEMLPILGGLCVKALVSIEVTGDRAVGAEIGMERVAGARLDDANERAAEHDLPRLEGDVVRCEFVGEPGDASGRVAEDSGGDT